MLEGSLRDKRLMDLARSGDFEAAIEYIRVHRVQDMKGLLARLHPTDDYSYEQFDVYADALSVVRDMGDLWGRASTS